MSGVPAKDRQNAQPFRTLPSEERKDLLLVDQGRTAGKVFDRWVLIPESFGIEYFPFNDGSG
jgi:hypothetical protein